MLEAITNQHMVLVRCYTFNHAAYIEDAMNGFCMQKTTFPFICAIVDDASTDGEPTIIKNYLQQNFDLEDKTFVRKEETDDYVMTLARHKTNKNCSFAVFFLKYNHFSIKKAKLPYLNRWFEKAKYIAACEGDDWWTNKLKLQTLVVFLENHPKYVLACHRINKYIQVEDRYVLDSASDIYFKKKQGISFGRYYNRFVNWKTQTLSTIYKKEVLVKSTRNYPYKRTDGINAYFPLKYGKGYCFNEYMATYRINKGGVWSRLNQEEKLYSNWQMYKNYDKNDKSTFSKLSFWEAYYKLLKKTGKKGYKEARFRKGIILFGKVFTIIILFIKKYYTILYRIKK